MIYLISVSGIQLVQENDGLKYIFKALNRGVNLKDADGAEYLRNVAAGFLLNYLDDQKTLQEQVSPQCNYLF